MPIHNAKMQLSVIQLVTYGTLELYPLPIALLIVGHMPGRSTCTSGQWPHPSAASSGEPPSNSRPIYNSCQAVQADNMIHLQDKWSFSFLKFKCIFNNLMIFFKKITQWFACFVHISGRCALFVLGTVTSYKFSSNVPKN